VTINTRFLSFIMGKILKVTGGEFCSFVVQTQKFTSIRFVIHFEVICTYLVQDFQISVLDL
jgi:hypothetical protein